MNKSENSLLQTNNVLFELKIAKGNGRLDGMRIFSNSAWWSIIRLSPVFASSDILIICNTMNIIKAVKINKYPTKGEIK